MFASPMISPRRISAVMMSDPAKNDRALYHEGMITGASNGCATVFLKTPRAVVGNCGLFPFINFGGTRNFAAVNFSPIHW